MNIVKMDDQVEFVTEFSEPILVRDNDGDVWFCPTKETVFFMDFSASWDETVSFDELIKEYGPLRPYDGTVELSN